MVQGVVRSSLTQVCVFSVGKCYTVPDGVDDGGKRKRKRASKLQDFRSWFRGTCESKTTAAQFDLLESSGKLCLTCVCVSVSVNPPEIKLKNGPTFTGDISASQAVLMLLVYIQVFLF